MSKVQHVKQLIDDLIELADLDSDEQMALIQTLGEDRGFEPLFDDIAAESDPELAVIAKSYKDLRLKRAHARLDALERELGMSDIVVNSTPTSLPPAGPTPEFP